ncbi:hypothetical protein Taro_002105 [Colocasia esculenta]|uniref:ATP-dependent DNA ligase family profile domain-containing protein n=1 Tax=Colocasia esculenta TaxID=4460 RepID=A0A843THW7_COLES|nr:hypothetical protein [Colocasia esculenta]
MSVVQTGTPAKIKQKEKEKERKKKREGEYFSAFDNRHRHIGAFENIEQPSVIICKQDLLVPSLLSKGIEFSPSTLEVVPGSPIPPMLTRIANGVSQVLNLFQDKAFTCEYKYDGQRAQIHRLTAGSIRVFSRNMGETTSKFPDLVKLISEACKPDVSTFILDAEIVAVDRKNGNRLMAFQQLSSRERGSRDSGVLLGSIKFKSLATTGQ